MSELHHECGIVALYHLPSVEPSPLCPSQGPQEVSRLMPRMLLDIQNRGQLSAGLTRFAGAASQLLDTHRELGSVSEVFRLSHRGKAESLMREYAGNAAIGHVRYATCGQEDRSYAQPFERHHLQKRKWFSFCFNGQLANYAELRDRLLEEDEHHLTRATDTEIIMHEISREYAGETRPELLRMMKNIAQRFDGAYSIALLNAMGEMLVARDPLGVKPVTYAFDGALFAAASESVALLNLGFAPDTIRSLEPGEAIIVTPAGMQVQRYIESPRRAHCFFEWIYFSNVASSLDGRSVYLTRKELGRQLAEMEDLEIDPRDTIVVPVPDTSKAAADAMAFHLKIPSVEGLIRNRYTGRTFIEGANRTAKAEAKYTPLREVLDGKRVLLVEDSIVRSTTMRVLVSKLRRIGRAKEIHVRVACPPIVAPCFYGIDMSTLDELFAPKLMGGKRLLPHEEAAMAEELGADSLRYLPVDAIPQAIGRESSELCQACITGEYPTPCGQQLYELAAERFVTGEAVGRTYEG